MSWRKIEAGITCQSCGTMYVASFSLNGTIPCFGFTCNSCHSRGKVIPPEIESIICLQCERRIDCLVVPPFLVTRFLVDGELVDFWHLGSGCPTEKSLIDDFRISYVSSREARP